MHTLAQALQELKDQGESSLVPSALLRVELTSSLPFLAVHLLLSCLYSFPLVAELPKDRFHIKSVFENCS